MMPGHRVRLNVFIDSEWHKQLQSIAERDDRSVGELVREGLRDLLRRDQYKGLGPIIDYVEAGAGVGPIKEYVKKEMKDER